MKYIVQKIVLLGHKDHGKSTLIGSLLMQTGAATKVRIAEATEYSKRLHKAFEPAFILDSFAEEREQGMTYDTTRAQIKYKDLAFEFIDVPGHDELIKNMMSGASYASFAVLLVSAQKDEGIRDQTKRHLFLAKMFGIQNIIVAVNKMDTISYDQKSFEQISDNLDDFLIKIGYKKKDINFVPISAYSAENLIKKSPKMKWYNGESLLDTIHTMLDARQKESTEGLRVIIQGVIGEGKDTLITGKISNGELRLGEKIKIIPSGAAYTVKGLFVKGTSSKVAKIGENIALKLDRSVKESLRGAVICRPSDKLVQARTVNAIVFVTKKLNKGTTLRFNGIETNAIIKISNLVDVVTGNDVSSKNLKPLNAANVSIKLNKPIAAEPFEVSKDLGRFVLYNGKEFSGIGIIKQAMK